MPLPTNTSRPNLPYTPDQSLPNNRRFDLLGRRPPTAEMFDAELNALTDDVNLLAAAINEVEAGNIPGSDNPLNANKVIKTDGEGHLSFTLIHSHQLVAGAVVEAALAAQSVTTEKLGDGAVSQNKMAADSITTTNLLDGAVTTAKIEARAVTTDKIADRLNRYQAEINRINTQYQNQMASFQATPPSFGDTLLNLGGRVGMTYATGPCGFGGFGSNPFTTGGFFPGMATPSRR